MTSYVKYSTVIFDIGDVLFSWSSQTKTSIPSETLRMILSSPTWSAYERGRLTEKTCYEEVGKEFSLDPSEVRNAILQARDSLKSDDEIIALIHELKSQSHGRLRVFAMSNISLPDYNVLRAKPADWSVFDEVFTSGEAGQRKPDLAFYKYVLARTQTDPRTTVFIDDKAENVLSARSFGIHGIVFHDRAKVMRTLRNLVGDPVERGQKFLNNHAGHLDSMTDTGIALKENFAQLLILETLNNRTLVNLVDHPRKWNFFQGNAILTTDIFPFDLDTTSIGLTVSHRDTATISSIMDEMLDYVNGDGIIQTYFDHRRPRFDPTVCVNILTLFYTHGRGHELRRTFEWVYDVLLNRAYLDGTRYYASGDSFLYFISRLLASSDAAELQTSLRPLLKERVQERIGVEGDALALAMRILTCDCVGIRDEVDLRALLPLQCEDGGWEIGWFYKYGSSGVKIGNRGLTSAFAISAIKAVERLSVPVSPPPSPTFDATEDSSHPFKGGRTPLTTKQRRNSLRTPLQWLWNSGKVRKGVVV